MLVLTRRVEQKLQIGPNITVTVLRIKGRAVKIGVEAPQGVTVLRTELLGQSAARELPGPGNGASEKAVAIDAAPPGEPAHKPGDNASDEEIDPSRQSPPGPFRPDCDALHLALTPQDRIAPGAGRAAAGRGPGNRASCLSAGPWMAV